MEDCSITFKVSQSETWSLKIIISVFDAAVEMISATAWCGIVYAIVGGQPMMINGGTGPVLAFTEILYKMSEAMDVAFLTFNAWIGLWICFYMCMAAFSDLDLVDRVNHWAGLMPEKLFKRARPLNASDAVKDRAGSLEDTYTVELSGGAGLLEFHLNHDHTEEHVKKVGDELEMNGNEAVKIDFFLEMRTTLATAKQTLR